MASGIEHDRLILQTAPVVAIIGAGVTQKWNLPLYTPAILTAAHLFGGFYLSPDLDTPSRPFYRWGIFRCIWLPYQKMIRHRSAWSHSPILGTAIRLLYLGAIASGIFQACGLLPEILSILKWNGVECWTIVIGIELSAIVHLQADKILLKSTVKLLKGKGK